MTVIAWDGKTLAADRMGTYGAMRRTRCKIRVLSPDVAVSSTGDVDEGLILKDWFEAGAKQEAYPKFQTREHFTSLVVCDHGRVYEYSSECVRIPVEDPYAAWGDGSDFAMGAMAMGADARKAVEMTIQHCVSCGNGVDAFDVQTGKEIEDAEG